jgi:hypothetical protein
MKTINLVALLSLITFSAIAEETPLMTQTQNQGQSTRIEQQAERQNMQTNMNENKLGEQVGTGSQNRIRTHQRIHTQAQDGRGGGQNMGGGMQGGGMKRGGK